MRNDFKWRELDNVTISKLVWANHAYHALMYALYALALILAFGALYLATNFWLWLALCSLAVAACIAMIMGARSWLELAFGKEILQEGKLAQRLLDLRNSTYEE